MIAVDTNLLVYAHRADLKYHSSAFSALRKLAEQEAAWSIPWPCLHEFYAVVTNPKIFKSRDATSPEKAVEQINAWLHSPNVQLLNENEEYWQILERILTKSQLKGGLVHDARVYAICEANRVKELLTADRDFSQFSGSLMIRNPL